MPGKMVRERRSALGANANEKWIKKMGKGRKKKKILVSREKYADPQQL